MTSIRRTATFVAAFAILGFASVPALAGDESACEQSCKAAETTCESLCTTGACREQCGAQAEECTEACES